MRKGPARAKTEIENPPRTTRAITRSANARTNRRRLKVQGVRVFLLAVDSADCAFVVFSPDRAIPKGIICLSVNLEPASSMRARTESRNPRVLSLRMRVDGSRHLPDEEVEQGSFLPLVDDGLPGLVRPSNHLDR